MVIVIHIVKIVHIFSVQFSQPTPLSINTNSNGTANWVGKRRRTVSLRKGSDPREELLRRSNTPDIKDVS